MTSPRMSITCESVLVRMPVSVSCRVGVVHAA